MSRALKRTRSDLDNASDITESTTTTSSVEPRRKKRKLTEFDDTIHPISQSPESKEQSIDINTNNKENDPPINDQSSSSKQSKKTKSRAKSKGKKKEKSKSKSEEASPEDAKKEIERLKSKHRQLLSKGYKCIVGVDEAGRGPLAGPVVIAAAYVPIDIYIDGITDSKKINEESEREKLYEQIIKTPQIKYSVSILDHTMIDEYNILEASLMGMRECVTKLHDQLINDGDEYGVDYALADGNRDPRFEYPEGLKYEYIIKGDGNIYCIGAASIIAKVTRDRMMEEYDKKWPEYKFKENKGYPTPFHKSIVMQNGPCDIHRKTFKPVKDWYKVNKPEIFKKVEALKKKRADERKKKLADKKKKKKKQKKENSDEDQDIDIDKKKKTKKTKKGLKSAKKKVQKDEKQKSIMKFLIPKKTNNDDNKGKDNVIEEEQKDVESDNE